MARVITVSFPDVQEDLLKDLDGFVLKARTDRSPIILRAIDLYLQLADKGLLAKVYHALKYGIPLPETPKAKQKAEQKAKPKDPKDPYDTDDEAEARRRFRAKFTPLAQSRKKVNEMVEEQMEKWRKTQAVPPSTPTKQ